MYQKAKIPTSPNKKFPFRLLAIVVLLLSQTSPTDQERDKYHPRIDLKKDNDEDNPRILAENEAQVNEKKEDDLHCKHSIIGETRCDQMR